MVVRSRVFGLCPLPFCATLFHTPYPPKPLPTFCRTNLLSACLAAWLLNLACYHRCLSSFGTPEAGMYKHA